MGVLSRASSTFKKLLEQRHKLTKPKNKAKKNRIGEQWLLDLVDEEIDEGHFIFRDAKAYGRSQSSQTLAPLANGMIPIPLYKHYDNLFRAFYAVPLHINQENLAEALNDCMGLLNLAENYNASMAVSGSIDVTLLRQGQVLFKSISNNPAAWVDVALRIKSPTIFKDAMIHLIGKWNLVTDGERQRLPRPIFQIAQRKYDELRLLKQALNLRIMGHYPNYIQKCSETEQPPGRTDYSNDIYGWMALSLFRHWFGQNLNEKHTLDLPDGGATFYYKLSKGGQAYLDRDECKDFHLLFPMTSRARTVLQSHLDAIKADVMEFVKMLMNNNSQLEVKTDGEFLGHLMCAEVEEGDYPWKVAGAEV